jgi:hypothetical protein
MEKVKITAKFKEELKELGCSDSDYVTVYKKEDGKVFFRSGYCKFHLLANEFDNIKYEETEEDYD